jgi:hypothetical protein
VATGRAPSAPSRIAGSPTVTDSNGDRAFIESIYVAAMPAPLVAAVLTGEPVSRARSTRA